MLKIHHRGSSRKAFTLTELTAVVAILAALILLLTPLIRHIRRKAKIASCEENLANISLGIRLYASEHQRNFPSSLSELVEGGYVEDERVFDCPSSKFAGDALEPDYHYTTGYTISSPSDRVLVFDKEENHKHGKHVLYTSGNIIWQNK